ncbi:hypothetical protein [Nocardioides pantholopis]|uniref:hypothetical protein n=1 Tax=Nocardioides pantholopis TaxID=2483798 RepID=UPI000FD957E2|nr:hypothetical protein [Nocardioides pantholopis]
MDVGLLVQLGAIAAVLVVLWVLPDWEVHRRRARRWGRRLGVVAAEPPGQSGPPIERLAADAARIRSAIRQAPSGTPAARIRGWLKAYDDVLVQACRALDLEQRLDRLPPGVELDFERERVERLQVRAGLLGDPRR